MDSYVDMEITRQEEVSVFGTMDLGHGGHSIEGKLKAVGDGKFTLSIKATDGSIEFSFTTVEQNELEGSGDSSIHSGYVTLKRLGIP